LRWETRVRHDRPVKYCCCDRTSLLHWELQLRHGNTNVTVILVSVGVYAMLTL
jgi:hypothetical protein